MAKKAAPKQRDSSNRQIARVHSGAPVKAYLAAAIALFAIETLIALFVHDGFVRPYLGDVLAVMLVYAALRAVTPLGAAPALTLTLVIALGVEIAQALNLLGALGLENNRLARIVLGGFFDWADLAAYAAGAIVICGIELFCRVKKPA